MPRLVDFNEIEAPLRQLLRSYGPPRSSYHPEYPFWRLQHDRIWEVVDPHSFPPRRSNTDPPVSALRSRHAQGGLIAPLYDALRRDPPLAARFGDLIASVHFPDMKGEVLTATGVLPA